jgi:hypothetical protein
MDTNLHEFSRIKERGMIFSGPMVRAILEGRKTQTRRIVKPQPDKDWMPMGIGLYNPTKIDRDGEEYPAEEVFGMWDEDSGWVCPYGMIGDRLWVRERFALHDNLEPPIIYYYSDDQKKYESDGAWKPSIHMPRWASRITLEVLKVRVERLQDIRSADVVAEGCAFASDLDYYRQIWNGLHGKGAWEKNPWVWVIEFRRVGVEVRGEKQHYGGNYT